jgi:hypothetical protein
MRSTRFVRPSASLVAAGLVALSLAGCGGGSGGSDMGLTGGGGGGGSTLRISVTDAPFPFDFVESASVTIEEVRVHERGSDAWTTVFTGSKTIDLVPLQNGVEALLVEAAVPPGTYDMVRLIVQAGEVVLTADAVVQGGTHTFSTDAGNLFFPSGAQTGIKIGIENDIVVTTRLSGDLLLDFDLSRNFVFNGPVTHAPGVRRVLFTPSVRATNASVAGSIRLRAMSDSLTPLDPTDDVPLAGATVSVYDAAAVIGVDPAVTTTSTGADGVAQVSVPPGTYQVHVEAASHEPATVGGVGVTLANLTDLGDVLLAATGTITGTVMSDAATPLDTTDDVVIDGATVEVHLAGDAAVLTTTTTDASGAFQVTGLAAGTYDLVFTAAGFTTLTVPGVAATIGGAGANYVLAAQTATLHGLVTDGGLPAATAAVTVVNSAGVTVGTTSTGADGTYSLVLATGDYVVTFTNGLNGVSVPVSITGATPPADVVLDHAF